MPNTSYVAGLHAVGADTYAYLQPDGSWGLSNCGLIVSGTQAVLVDTCFTLELTRRLLDAVHTAVQGMTITTVVNSHPNGDHCWGNQLVEGAEIIGAAACATGMCEEISPRVMTSMAVDTDPASAIGRYQREHFGNFDFDGIVLTPPTRTFTGATMVTVGDRTVEVIEVGPAHSVGDVIVHAADAGVIFTGDIIFNGDHPIMWTGPMSNWINACEQILKLDPQVVVPGHGPVTDTGGVAGFRDYLIYVNERATALCQAGLPFDEAARTIAAEKIVDWGHPERLMITVGGIYRTLGAADPSRPELITLMSQMRYAMA